MKTNSGRPVELVQAQLLKETGFAPPRPTMDWRCPAHDDSTASLSVSEGADGRVLLHCHAGCDLDVILDRLHLEPTDLFPQDPSRTTGTNTGEWTPRGEAVAVYDYVGEDGKLLFQVLRTAAKEFPQRRPDSSKRGGWAWSTKDTRRVLYRLPRVLQAVDAGDAVFVCEGEKDVQAIEAAGAVATCNPGGAGKWADEYSQVLRGTVVVVVADRDKAGRDHARRVAASLEGVAASVVVCEAIQGKDATDHLRAGHTLEELEVWMPEEYTPEEAAPPVATESTERTSWWPRQLTGIAPEVIEPAWLRRNDGVALLYPGRLNALVGESESCKTWCAYLAVVEAAEAGQHVLLVDFEDYEATAQSRLIALGCSVESLRQRIHFVHPEEPILDPRGRATSAQQDLDEALRDWPVSIAIFDGVTEGMTLEGLNPLDNGDVARWYRAVPKRVTVTGAAGAVIDHVTKDRDQRGRYALGGVHKLNGLDGAAYTLEATEPFAPGHTGRVTVTVAKDRPGYIRARSVERKRVGDLVLVSSEEGRVGASISVASQSETFLPTALMEKVSRRCELYPGETKTELRKLGNSDWVDRAVRCLIDRGQMEVRREGMSHRHYVLTPYRGPVDGGNKEEF